MRRSILFSLMVIGAVIAVVAGASTFSAFTSNDSIQGTVTAGKLVVDIDESPNIDTTFTLDSAVDCDPSAMAPGDDCKVTLVILNDTTQSSNLELFYTADITKLSGDANNCFKLDIGTITQSQAGDSPASETIAGPANAVQLKHLQAAGDGEGGATDALDPGDSDTFVLHVTLLTTGDGSFDCQNAGTLTIKAAVAAEQTGTPHD